MCVFSPSDTAAVVVNIDLMKKMKQRGEAAQTVSQSAIGGGIVGDGIIPVDRSAIPDPTRRKTQRKRAKKTYQVHIICWYYDAIIQISTMLLCM